ncbi:hypothetical protein CLU88_1898 [Acidovorax sp. 56]|nr:hypothetical protein CLU88_1898 [Acidovorax sp. 56]
MAPAPNEPLTDFNGKEPAAGGRRLFGVAFSRMNQAAIQSLDSAKA